MLVIRKMKEMDIPAVARLEAEIFPDPWSEQALMDSYRQKQTLLLAAYEDRQLIGYLIMYYALEDGEIARIAVIPQKRRQGVGGRLLLDVRESNGPAISFYTDYGFVQDGIRRRYYTDPVEDGVLMSRDLGK